MKPLPPFDKDGLLPPGTYELTFSGNSEVHPGEGMQGIEVMGAVMAAKARRKP